MGERAASEALRRRAAAAVGLPGLGSRPPPMRARSCTRALGGLERRRCAHTVARAPPRLPPRLVPRARRGDALCAVALVCAVAAARPLSTVTPMAALATIQSALCAAGDRAAQCTCSTISTSCCRPLTRSANGVGGALRPSGGGPLARLEAHDRRRRARLHRPSWRVAARCTLRCASPACSTNRWRIRPPPSRWRARRCAARCARGAACRALPPRVAPSRVGSRGRDAARRCQPRWPPAPCSPPPRARCRSNRPPAQHRGGGCVEWSSHRRPRCTSST